MRQRERSFGSKASRSASPNRLNPKTARLMATPGQTAIHGALRAATGEQLAGHVCLNVLPGRQRGCRLSTTNAMFLADLYQPIRAQIHLFCKIGDAISD